ADEPQQFGVHAVRRRRAAGVEQVDHLRTDEHVLLERDRTVLGHDDVGVAADAFASANIPKLDAAQKEIWALEGKLDSTSAQ
ncbi:hypothetical protein IAE22_35375, partial [Bacillus sp. S34]|nr:hypothetical protein [Bacillus sp. S34]